MIYRGFLIMYEGKHVGCIFWGKYSIYKDVFGTWVELKHSMSLKRAKLLVDNIHKGVI